MMVTTGKADVFTGEEVLPVSFIPEREKEEEETWAENLEEGGADRRQKSQHHLRGAASMSGGGGGGAGVDRRASSGRRGRRERDDSMFGAARQWMSRRAVDPNAMYEPLTLADVDNVAESLGGASVFSYELPDASLYEDDYRAESDGRSDASGGGWRGGDRGGRGNGVGAMHFYSPRPQRMPPPPAAAAASVAGPVSSEWHDNLDVSQPQSLRKCVRPASSRGEFNESGGGAAVR